MVILYSSIMLLFWLLRLKFIFNTQIYLKYIKKTNKFISLFGFRSIIFTNFFMMNTPYFIFLFFEFGLCRENL